MFTNSEDTLEEPRKIQREPATFQALEEAAPFPSLWLIPAIESLLTDKSYCQLKVLWSPGGHLEMLRDIVGWLRLGWEYYKPNILQCTGQPSPQTTTTTITICCKRSAVLKLLDLNRSCPFPVMVSWHYANSQPYCQMGLIAAATQWILRLSYFFYVTS